MGINGGLFMAGTRRNAAASEEFPSPPQSKIDQLSHLAVTVNNEKLSIHCDENSHKKVKLSL
jgi:hypothetical protein